MCMEYAIPIWYIYHTSMVKIICVSRTLLHSVTIIGNVDNREMAGTKENLYKKITNCMFWGLFYWPGVLSIPVAILYGHIIVRSEVKMVSQEMGINKQELKIDIQKQEVK